MTSFFPHKCFNTFSANKRFASNNDDKYNIPGISSQELEIP